MAVLGEKQKRSIAAAVYHRAPVYIWHGSVRSGKTAASSIGWMEHVRSGPRGGLIMVGKTLDTLERNVIQPLQDMFPRGAIRHTRLSTTCTILGRVCWLMGASDRKAEDRIRGMTLAGAYVDEGTLLPDNFWPMLRTRLSVDGAKLFVTTNPDNPMHWMYKDVILPAEKLGFEEFAFRLADNPGLSQAYRDQLDREMKGLFRARYIDGKWVAAEGAVYDMLDLTGDHRVTWDQVPTLEQFLLGVDYGTAGTTHAVLLGLGAWPGRQPNLYVIAEWVWNAREQQRQLTDAQQAAAITKWLQGGHKVPTEKLTGRKSALVVPIVPHRTAVDPSAMSFKLVLGNQGWPQLVVPEGEFVLDGIRATASLLGAGRLLFVEGAAPRLEAELVGYVWDEKEANAGRDKPVKENDHGVDALRYAIMSGRYLWRWWLTIDG